MIVAFVLVIGACAKCGALFAFNPVRVPSVVVDGRREPLCRPCVTTANTIRASRGLPVWPIYPDAYEPIDESAVPWPDD